MTDEQRSAIVAQEIVKAKAFLADAEKLVSIDMWNVSANRAYYALYHAILALMIHDGHAPKTHSGLITEFGKEYILTGKFDKAHSKILSQIRIIREKCDYDAFYYATKEEILPILESTKSLVDIIEKKL